MKISAPPLPPPPPHTHILVASGCEKRMLQKIRLRKWHQLQLKYNSEVGKVSTNFAAAKNGKVGSNFSAAKNGQVSSNSKKR